MTTELTLGQLKDAGKVTFRRVPSTTINSAKKLFLKLNHKNSSVLRRVSVDTRFQYFYVWYVYFRMLSWHSFLNILNVSGVLKSFEVKRKLNKEKKLSKKKTTLIHGGLFGIAISAIVAGIAAAASKAATVTAATAAIIGSSSAASTIATSVAGGIGGALAGAATEAIIKAS